MAPQGDVLLVDAEAVWRQMFSFDEENGFAAVWSNHCDFVNAECACLENERSAPLRWGALLCDRLFPATATATVITKRNCTNDIVKAGIFIHLSLSKDLEGRESWQGGTKQPGTGAEIWNADPSPDHVTKKSEVKERIKWRIRRTKTTRTRYTS